MYIFGKEIKILKKEVEILTNINQQIKNIYESNISDEENDLIVKIQNLSLT